jgi:predicted ATPase/class 3 adenylate cyclase
MTLPTGTVTFLYTDIEGSTRLWEQQPEAMRPAVARHDAILRQAIEANGGQIFRTAGDAFCAAFATAAPAVAAAVDARRALTAEPWNLDQPLRVRIVLHSTEAVASHGDYVGGGLNRLGRLLAACHGGQTLLSQAAEQLARDHLPTNVTLLDLGQHRLRDLIRPDRIFQLVIAGLHTDFPPLKSLDAIPNNLPAQLTSFVGRTRELEQVVTHLSVPAGRQDDRRERLLTLTGPGGTGKTRLSLQAAAELSAGFPDGVWFVELAPLSDPSLVAQAIAAVLGLREIAGRPLDALLADYLRDKRLLLVLDNCEHLIDACARIADQLLRACPELRILASSRESLGIAGETVLRLPSLAVPDLQALPPLEELARFESVQLFAERAASVQPGFRLTAQNAPAVAQISSRLDGIPLALELAAARVRSLSPEQIAARLDDRFRLLTGGSRAAVQRQQTLQALVDWSYDLLSPPERALLRRLAVFAGGWTLEAAEGVCAWGEIDVLEVFDLLDHLVNKSLINADSAGNQVRYGMQETIRQYAQDKLVGSGEATAARNCHLAYFAEELARLAPRGREAGRPQYMRWAQQEQENLRSAVEWALDADVKAAIPIIFDLCLHWIQRGSTREGRALLARALARTDASPEVWHGDGRDVQHQSLLGTAWFADGMMALFGGDTAGGRSAMEKAIALLRPLGDSDLLAGAYGFAGIAAGNSQDFTTALAYSEQALRLARQLGNRWIEAMQLITLGVASRYGADTGGHTWADFEQGMAILAELGDRYSQAVGHQSAARAYLQAGDLASAERHFEQAIPLFDEHGYLLSANVGRSGLADIARLQGDYERALALYPAVIRVWRLADQRGAMARCLECLGFIAGSQAADAADPLPLLRRAATLYGAAEAIRRINNAPMTPWEQTEYDGRVRALRSRLDPDALDAAWRAGTRLDLDQAVDFATHHSAR